MQAILEGELRVLGQVGNDELQREGLIDRDDVVGSERGEGCRLRTIRQAKPQTDAAIGRRSELLQLPGLNAGKPMLAQTFARPEPGEYHRDAAPDRLSLGEPAALAHKEQRRLVVLLELRDVGAVQVDYGRAPGRADFEHGQFVLPVEKDHAPEGFGFRFWV